ncbi:putative tetratricopeptide-like helical domain superfamily [Helianthus anomalus]
MRSIKPHFRALNTPHQRTISTSSSETLSRTPNPEKTFFKFQNKHEEAIINLCQKSRLTEAIQRALEGTKRMHSHIKSSNFLLGVSSYNRIIDIYCKFGNLVDALKVFDEIPEKDLCSWNTMVSGYAKAGRLKDAHNQFDEMPERDNFSWTTIISGNVRHGFRNEGLRLYRAMLKDYNVKCNKFTVCSVLAASAAAQSLTIGKEIHGHIVRMGIDSDGVVWSALSDMYGKCGNLDEARHIFDKTSDKYVVTWTAMIDRYFKSARRDEGFLLFSELLKSGNKPNKFTFAGILSLCALYNLESIGKPVHGYMARIGFNQSSFAASALIHMYCRCGNTKIADRVFKWVMCVKCNI